MDSRASSYMTFNEDIFVNFTQQSSKPVNIGDRSDLEVHSRGDIVVGLLKNN